MGIRGRGRGVLAKGCDVPYRVLCYSTLWVALLLEKGVCTLNNDAARKGRSLSGDLFFLEFIGSQLYIRPSRRHCLFLVLRSQMEHGIMARYDCL